MNNPTITLLQKHFDIALDAPDGIKKLRELILTLAMQGKLVPQDPKGQPASELLKEIAAEKKRLVKAGKIKAPKPLPAIKPEDVPYTVPKGWEWVRFEEICSIITQGPNPKYNGRGVPNFRVLKTKDFYDDRILYQRMESIEESLFDEYSKYQLKNFDIIFGLVGKGSTAKCNIYIEQEDLKSIFTRATGLLRLVNAKSVSPLLIHSFFRSSHGRRKTDEITDGSTGQLVIRTSELKKILFPRPPLAEPKRIVAKIDQLIAICDALEKLRESRQQKRLDIHTAAITRLLDAHNPVDAMSSWNFLQKHFGELYVVKENVANIRKAILQLAMMGKLVSQDPNDQPASELLKEIEAEKKRLVKAGKIKAPKPIPDIKPEDVPYAVPTGWEWVTIRHICHDWGQKEPDADFTYIDVGSIDNSRGCISSPEILSAQDAPSRARKIVKKGSVIYSTVRPYLLNIAIVDKDFFPEAIASTAFAIVHPYCQIHEKFVYFFLRSPHFITYVESTMKGVAYPAINDGDFFEGLLPLPPLAEQKRIVAKIDQLMALCDTLEKGIDEATRKQSAVLGAVLSKV